MEVLVKCPHCRKRKLYVNSAKRVGYCQRCQRAFSRSDIDDLGLLRRVAHNPYVRPLAELPPLVDAWTDPDATAYLRGRGVVSGEPVYYDARGRRLYFRIWSPSPDVPPSWHTRGIDPGSGWIVYAGTDKRHYLFGNPHVRAGAGIVLVEGIFDALRIGTGAIALLGTRLYPTQEAWVTTFGRIGIWLDPDDAGTDATARIRRRLLFLRPDLDLMECHGGTEPGDLPVGHGLILGMREWLEESAA